MAINGPRPTEIRAHRQLREIILDAIAGADAIRNATCIAAGISGLLGPRGRARARRDAARIRRAGDVPLTVALLARAGAEIEALVTTVIAPRVLN